MSWLTLQVNDPVPYPRPQLDSPYELTNSHVSGRGHAIAPPPSTAKRTEIVFLSWGDFHFAVHIANSLFYITSHGLAVFSTRTTLVSLLASSARINLDITESQGIVGILPLRRGVSSSEFIQQANPASSLHSFLVFWSYILFWIPMRNCTYYEISRKSVTIAHLKPVFTSS